MPKLVLYTNEANLIKLPRKINHNEKVCRAHDLIPTPKVKVAIRSEVKIVPEQ